MNYLSPTEFSGINPDTAERDVQISKAALEAAKNPDSHVARVFRAQGQVDVEDAIAAGKFKDLSVIERLTSVRDGLFSKFPSVQNQTVTTIRNTQIASSEKIEFASFVETTNKFFPAFVKLVDELYDQVEALGEEKDSAAVRLGAIIYYFGVMMHRYPDANGQTLKLVVASYLHEFGQLKSPDIKFRTLDSVERSFPGPFCFYAPDIAKVTTQYATPEISQGLRNQILADELTSPQLAVRMQAQNDILGYRTDTPAAERAMEAKNAIEYRLKSTTMIGTPVGLFSRQIGALLDYSFGAGRESLINYIKTGNYDYSEDGNIFTMQRAISSAVSRFEGSWSEMIEETQTHEQNKQLIANHLKALE